MIKKRRESINDARALAFYSFGFVSRMGDRFSYGAGKIAVSEFSSFSDALMAALASRSHEWRGWQIEEEADKVTLRLQLSLHLDAEPKEDYIQEAVTTWSVHDSPSKAISETFRKARLAPHEKSNRRVFPPNLNARVRNSLGVGLAAVLALLLSACTSLFYHPTTEQHFNPAQLDLSPEEIVIPSTDGVNLLHGWYFKSPVASKGVVLFCHGNAENISSHFATLAWLPKQGYDYFVFDYRGFGASTGTPSPTSTLEDAKTALQWLYSRNPKLPITIFGQSLGGAVALRSAIDLKDRVPYKLVIVDSAFHSYQEIARKVMAKSWFLWPAQFLAYALFSDDAAAGARVKEIAPRPLVVIHGDNDFSVPFSSGERIFELAAEPKEFWHVARGSHTDALWRVSEAYRERFVQKLNQVSKNEF